MGNCWSCLRRVRFEEAEEVVLNTERLEEGDYKSKLSEGSYGGDVGPKRTTRLERLIVGPVLNDETYSLSKECLPAVGVNLRRTSLKGTQILSRPNFIVEDLFTTTDCTMYGIDSIRSEVAESGVRVESELKSMDNSESRNSERERLNVVHRRWIRRRLMNYARYYLSSLTVNGPDSWTN